MAPTYCLRLGTSQLILFLHSSVIILVASFVKSHDPDRDVDIACCYDHPILSMYHLGEEHIQLDDIWT